MAENSSPEGSIKSAAPAITGDDDPNRASFDDFSRRLSEKSGTRKPKPVNNGEPHDETNEQDQAAQGQAMGLAMKLGSELLAALLVGSFLGFGIDMVFDTKPLFLLIGLALGCAAAFLNVLRMMKKLSYIAPDSTSPDQSQQNES